MENRKTEFITSPTILESAIKTLLDNSSLNTVQKADINIVDDDEEEKSDENQDCIVNPNYDLVSAFDFSSLTKDEINNIAVAIYKDYKQETNAFSEVKKYEIEKSEDADNAIQKALKIVDNFIVSAENLISGISSGINTATSTIAGYLKEFSKYSGSSALGGTISGIANALANNLIAYQDGITETSFGTLQEESWGNATSESFLQYFKEANQSVTNESDRRVDILKSTPLDSGENREALYGTMIMGCPYLYNAYADPFNRTLVNTLIKDSRYISFTPGMPEYHGTSYALTEASQMQYKQTEDGWEMLNYLLRNGLDDSFSNKDKRYYTFKTDYKAYFSYLETMLNAVWIKLGLAKSGNTFNIFSFFNIKDNSSNGNIAPEKYDELLEKYNHSLGFFLSSSSNIAESVSNSSTSTGGELASQVNSSSDTYQRLNYITGMGTGGPTRNAMRSAANVVSFAENMRDFMSSTFQYAAEGFSNDNKLLALVKGTIGAGVDITKLTTSQDLGSIIQSFSVANGMRVVYPELWSDSNYSRSISLEFNFVSPYGDPLSIFKYVYVPFCALACFALPRQAAENGYVSPFFVRADVPGLFTSDLALITDITWTKGGGNNLWTKDGLPRAMSVSITLSDLYPYLSMSRRLSFLSANPSYTVFLDNMAGLMRRKDDNATDSLNDYFKTLIDRVNGIENNGNELWNKFNSYKSAENKRISREIKNSISGKLNMGSVPWLHDSNL